MLCESEGKYRVFGGGDWYQIISWDEFLGGKGVLGSEKLKVKS